MREIVRGAVLRAGRRLVGALLRLYPRSFRERYGAEMREAFEVQARARLERRGPAGMPGLWLRTAWGMTKGALAERGARDERRGGGSGMGGGSGWFGTLALELRHAGRRLRRSPLFAVLAIATVGFGVGAFASVYAVVESVLLEPLPWEEPDELQWVWRDYAWFDLSRGWLGGPDVAYMAEREEVFSAVSAVMTGLHNLTGRSDLDPREVAAFHASAKFFDLLGAGPTLGRGFLPGEDAPDAPGVAVLTRALWMDLFGGSRDAIGGEIRLDGEPYTVVGVLPEDFPFVMPTSLGGTRDAELFVPLRMDLAAQNPGSGFLTGLVRVRPDVPAEQTEAAFATVADRVDEGWGEGRDLRLWAAPMKEDLVGGVRPALLTILAAAGFLVLVLGANLATLLLARAATGERDAAVRTALGAGRAAVAGTLVAEALVIATAGTALALLVGARGAELLARLASDAIPRTAEVALDASGVAVTVGAVLLLVGAAVVAPAAKLLRARPGGALRAASVRGGSRAASRSRGALVVAQVALSIVLLVGAGLLTRSMAGLLRADPGFDAEGTLTLRVALDGNAYPDDEAVLGFLDGLEARVASLPGVAAVGATDALPLSATANQTSVTFPGAPGNTGHEDEDAPLVDVLRITPGYVEAAGLRLLAGRPSHRSGRVGGSEDGAPEVLLDDILANRFFPGGVAAALGGRVSVQGDTAVVVGVVDHARVYEVNQDGRGQIYHSMALYGAGAFNLAVRMAGAGDPSALTGPVRASVRAMDPTVPVSEVRTLDGLVDAALGDERLNLLLVAAFALAALLLAGLGIYGVVSSAVVRRRPEIGVRMAMGAQGGDVVRMVLAQGLRLVAAGAVLGLAGAALVSRFLEGLLVGVRPLDPATYLAVTAVLVTVAGLAGWIPARRATRVPPSEALRSE